MLIWYSRDQQARQQAMTDEEVNLFIAEKKRKPQPISEV
jgi:hypothetical protein